MWCKWEKSDQTKRTHEKEAHNALVYSVQSWPCHSVANVQKLEGIKLKSQTSFLTVKLTRENLSLWSISLEHMSLQSELRCHEDCWQMQRNICQFGAIWNSDLDQSTSGIQHQNKPNLNLKYEQKYLRICVTIIIISIS